MPRDSRTCYEPGCTATLPAHKWGQIKGHSDGWFTQTSGEVWCPDHNPKWVTEWREKRTHKNAITEIPSEDIKTWIGFRFSEWAILCSRDNDSRQFGQYLYDMDNVTLQQWRRAFYSAWKREQNA